MSVHIQGTPSLRAHKTFVHIFISPHKQQSGSVHICPSLIVVHCLSGTLHVCHLENVYHCSVHHHSNSHVCPAVHDPFATHCTPLKILVPPQLHQSQSLHVSPLLTIEGDQSQLFAIH
ncbi:hypothetical protein GW750_03970 [bacterium]|nr:hypothetical protein [bacterium]